MDITLVFSAFIAGVITFLAPCTLPLVPGYLGFISGVSTKDLEDPSKRKKAKRTIILNGLYYVIGFSAVFILMGTVFASAGIALAPVRQWLIRIGAVLIILFALSMLHVFKLPFFQKTKSLPISKHLKAGTPKSSFIFGASFAVGWTPCVGPILAAILLLATDSATVWQGAFLLLVFSIGLAIPFMLVALGIGHATQAIKKMAKFLFVIEILGGLLLLVLGILLLTNNFGQFISFFFQLFGSFEYEGILRLL